MNDGHRKGGGCVREKQWLFKGSNELETCGTVDSNGDAKRVLPYLNKTELAFMVALTADIRYDHRWVRQRGFTRLHLRELTVGFRVFALCSVLLSLVTCWELLNQPLAFYPGLPFPTSNLLLPILFPGCHPTTHQYTCMCTQQHAQVHTHSHTHIPSLMWRTPQLTAFMRVNLPAKCSQQAIWLKMRFLIPNTIVFIKPAPPHLRIKSLWSSSAAKIIHFFNPL